MEQINWKALLGSLALSLGVGIVSALLTMGGMQQYQDMYQPPLAPPGWLFPVVWTVLFLLMGVASWLVYRANADVVEKKQALRIYLLQLIVNFFWSILFFNFGLCMAAFVWLVLLWGLVLLTAVRFWRIAPTAGKLMIPYLLWVTFAGYLNLAICLLN